MKVAINKFKEELSKRKEELQDDLTPRLDEMLEIIESEILEGEEIYLVDLIICIIHRADRIPAKYMIDLMEGLTSDSLEYLDKWTISRTASFIKSYFDKDKIYCMLKSKKNKKPTIES